MSQERELKKILTINPGSTAVKYFLFNAEKEVLEERVFDRKSLSFGREEKEFILHSDADVVSVRIVHALDLAKPSVFTKQVETKIKTASEFAPIHNPLAMEVIDFIKRSMPSTLIVVVPDTSFHFMLPEYRKTYPIDLKFKEQFHIRRYGFHGLALEYILFELEKQFAKQNKKAPQNFIVAHLGGGVSVTAIQNKISIDTTMGLTPLEGVMMTTRSGSIDPAIVSVLVHRLSLPVVDVIKLLNEQSGFYGLTGSKDTKFIIDQAQKNIQPYKLATDIFIDQVTKAIFAAYSTIDSTVEYLIFSGGIGFNNEYVREKILEKTRKINLTQSNTLTIDVHEEEVLFRYGVKLFNQHIQELFK